LSTEGIAAAVESTHVLCQVVIDGVLYDCCLTHSLEEYLKNNYSPHLLKSKPAPRTQPLTLATIVPSVSSSMSWDSQQPQTMKQLERSAVPVNTGFSRENRPTFQHQQQQQPLQQQLPPSNQNTQRMTMASSGVLYHSSPSSSSSGFGAQQQPQQVQQSHVAGATLVHHHHHPHQSPQNVPLHYLPRVSSSRSNDGITGFMQVSTANQNLTSGGGGGPAPPLSSPLSNQLYSNEFRRSSSSSSMEHARLSFQSNNSGGGGGGGVPVNQMMRSNYSVPPPPAPSGASLSPTGAERTKHYNLSVPSSLANFNPQSSSFPPHSAHSQSFSSSSASIPVVNSVVGGFPPSLAAKSQDSADSNNNNTSGFPVSSHNPPFHR
jgi:hypothetical protein